MTLTYCTTLTNFKMLEHDIAYKRLIITREIATTNHETDHKMMTNHEIDLRPRDVMTNDKAYYNMTKLKLHGTVKRRESATKNIIPPP